MQARYKWRDKVRKTAPCSMYMVNGWRAYQLREVDQHNAAIGSGKSAQATHERQHRLGVVLHWFCSARRVYRMDEV